MKTITWYPLLLDLQEFLEGIEAMPDRQTDRQNIYSLKSFYMTYKEQHINLNGRLGDSYTY